MKRLMASIKWMPMGPPNLPQAISFTEPNFAPNGRNLAFLNHYKSCILEGLKKGVLNKRA